jgi:hypothetical protein
VAAGRSFRVLFEIVAVATAMAVQCHKSFVTRQAFRDRNSSRRCDSDPRDQTLFRSSTHRITVGSQPGVSYSLES